MAVFCVTIFIIVVSDKNNSNPFIYLTIWSYLILTLSFVALSFVSLIHYFQRLKQNRQEETSEVFTTNPEGIMSSERNDIARNERTQRNVNDIYEQYPFFRKLLWMLWTVAACCGLLVTLLYWSLVFKSPTSFFDISLHCLNSVFILVALLTSLLQVNLLHAVYVMCFGSIYIVFTVIYWAAGGLNDQGERYIYKPLDYENGNHAFVVGTVLISIFLFIPLLQLLIFGLYQLRRYLNKRFYPESDGRENGTYNVET